jgi:hypothetical protein
VTLALALSLALAACAEGESSTAAVDDYVYPASLVAAGEALAMAPASTPTTAPPMSAPEDPETPPLTWAAQQALSSVDPLPLPTSELLPGAPTSEPFVVTQDGERRLLREVSVTVSYDPHEGLTVDPAGWWVVNYPLDRIRGLDLYRTDEIARLLTGHDAEDLTNYYFYTAPAGGVSVAPPAKKGPAPISVTPGPDLVVNNRDPEASDDNDGSAAHPLLTISAAVERAVPGTVIHVYPGIYRERVVVDTDGTPEAPISIEGIRGAAGSMPVITGNDPFPVGAWQEVEGSSGVWEASAFTDLSGSLTASGESLVERDAPWNLQPGEYAVSGGGDAYTDPRFDGDSNAREGAIYDFGSSQYIWERTETDSGGFVDLGSEFGDGFGGGVYWGSSWVYVRKPSEASNYDWYHDESRFDVQVSGPFRSAGVSGEAVSAQPYRYRVWLDGILLDSNVFATADNGEADLAHPDIGIGDYGETWQGVVMEQGWHHFVFQWDTTTAPGATEQVPVFRFGVPEIIGNAISSAEKPRSSRYGPSGEGVSYVSEYLVLGPVPSTFDPTVFVRLPDGADPNDVGADIAARSGPVVSILGDFVELHGFEVGGGAQHEGEALIEVGHHSDDGVDDAYVQGAVVEGNYVTGSQHTGIGAAVSGDMGVAPIEISNNWVVDSGAVGISVTGLSERLTEKTLNDWAPGRTMVTVDFNTVVNSGWAGYDRITDVSGIEFERMTASTIAYNTIIHGGPGITLRGENYAVRVDGNTISDPYAWGIGIEANPGPNLIANNLITGLRTGPAWMKAGILTWDSDQTWIVNNTIDGLWSIETGWYGDVGTWGAGGPENFERMDYPTWDFHSFRRSYLNNLVLGNYLGGIEDYLGNWGELDTFSANYREVPQPDPFDYLADGAEAADVRRDFVDREGGDYRLVESSELNSQGVVNVTSRLAPLDLLGLPRLSGETTSVGAYRETPDIAAGTTVVEVLFVDGIAARLVD